MAVTIRQTEGTYVEIADGPAWDDNGKRYMRLEVGQQGSGFAALLSPQTVEQLAEIFKRWGES